MSRTPSRSSLALLSLLALGGCTEPSAAVFPTGNEAPPGARRRPDGVAIDPVSAPPPVADRANASDGLVALRAPLGTDVAVTTVLELFRRIVREDADELAPLFTKDAQVMAPGGGPTGASMVHPVQWYKSRFSRLDYTRLAGEQVVRRADLEITRGDDLADLGRSLPRSEPLAASDVLIRAPVATPRAGQDRLLGDEVVLWLRREGDQYKIYRVAEDFQIQ